MKHPIFFLSLSLLAGCAAPKSAGSNQQQAHKPTQLQQTKRDHVPRYSMIHIKGTITDVHEPADWPESVKAGAPFEGWGTIDNRVPHSDQQPGVFVQRGWPAHFDIVAGRMVLSAKEGDEPKFAVTVYDKQAGVTDGYVISAMHYVSLPEAPRVKNVTLKILVLSSSHDIVQSDRLPVHDVPLTVTDARLKCYGAATSDGSARSFEGTIEKFEVIQSTSDPSDKKSRRRKH